MANLYFAVLGEGPREVRGLGDDARGELVSSGVYAYVLESAGQREIKRMTLVR